MSFFEHFITLSGKKQNNIAARYITFSPHNPKKPYRKLQYVFFSEKLILATSAKYRHPITSFTRLNATTQHTMQLHTRPNETTLKTCFHVDATSKLRKQLLLNDAARINVTDKLANRCTKSC
jgi:hypothetical protein